LNKIWTWFVGDAKWYVSARRRTSNPLDVLLLVVEEDVRLELVHHPTLIDTTKKEHFIDFDTPLAECRH
jgi:hypothetical protein